MELLWKDIRYSIQSLRARPAFALVSILTLALGIGATTAIFSVVNAVLLRPLPLHEPGRLTMVWEQRHDEPGATNVVAPANFVAWQQQSTRLFSSMGSTFDWELSLTGHGEPALVRAGLVSADLFRTLGARPFLGRVITTEDEDNVVLSHALWRRKFGGDRRVIGKQVLVSGTPMTVIGVMPREFAVPTSRADLWVPYDVPEQARGRYLSVIARLAPGVAQQQAQAGMSAIAKRLESAHRNNTGYGVNLVPVHEQVVGNVRRILLIVLAAVALLLVIACVNIANLLLSRATVRAREMAVRAALGATRGRLVRQLLTESLILAVLGGILGAVLAGWATMLLVRFTPESAMLPRMTEIMIDGRVLAVSALLTLATGVIFGIAPAMQASRTDLNTGLKSSSRGATDRGGKRFRNALVVAEVALATVLLIGAGLLIKSFARLERVESGVRPEGVLTMRVVLPDFEEQTLVERRRIFAARMLEEIRRVPGVAHAGGIVTINMPFTGLLSNTDFRIEGAPPPAPGQEPAADIRVIAGDYFHALGMPILRGRPLDERAIAPQQTEFVVNDAFVRKYFPDGKAVGRRLSVEWFADLSGEIVGVVGNVRAAGLDKEIAPAIYFSYAHDGNSQLTLLIRSTGDPLMLQKPVTTVLRKLDPLMPVSDVKPLTALVSGTIARPRFNTTMVSLFAALGLILASIGTYGVLSYAVAQRTHEMGIRMALGADPRDVKRLVVRDGVTMAAIGVLIGVIAALPATRTLAALLYNVRASDPAVFATVAATLTVVAMLASYIPARRATRVDPMVALRPE